MPTFLPTAVLLKRNDATNRFWCKVDIDVDIPGFAYNLKQTWWRLTSVLRPENGGVLFDAEEHDRPGEWEGCRRRMVEVDVDGIGGIAE